jgi:hypothetical protein
MSLGGKSRNKAEQARFDAIKAAGVCLACKLRGVDSYAVEIHHLLSGGRRIGHMATVGLCCWHHRGVPFEFMSHAECRDAFGPALSEGSKPFHREFGPDAELLAMQNELLDEIEAELEMADRINDEPEPQGELPL